MKKAPAVTEVYEYDQHGDAVVLQRRERELAPPGIGEVTVQVVSAGINHMDVFLRNGKEQSWADEPWPRRSGSDFAGIVVAVGEAVSSFRRGDEVMGHVRSGAHARHLTVAAADLVLKPKGLLWEVAGSLYLAGVTALDVLDELRIGRDDTIVVSAAAGGVGSLQVQLAKHWGARVIGTCGDRNFDYLRQLGIIPVRYGEGMVERIQHVAHGPVTAFIDNFGKDGSDIAREIGVPEDRYRSSEYRREIELRLLAGDEQSVAHGTSQLRRLAALAHEGAFRLLVSGIYHFDDVVEAYEDLARLHARGKIVLATNPVSRERTLRARDVFEQMA